MSAKDQVVAAAVVYVAGLVGLVLGRLVLDIAPMLQFLFALIAAGAVFALVDRRLRGRRRVVATRSGRSRIVGVAVLFVLIAATQWLQLHYPESWPVVAIVALLPLLLASQALIAWWQGDRLVQSPP